jgi:hypothetical protein
MSSAGKSVGPLGKERRVLPRYQLMPQVDIIAEDGHETYWGTLKDLSRTGVAVSLQQALQSNQKVTVRFRLQSDDGRAVLEELDTTVAWKSGHNAGLEFVKPLIQGSSSLKKAPLLAAHLEKKKSER